MKLRILNNSIRLRLSMSEVSEVSTDNIVKGEVKFSGGETFKYFLKSLPDTYVTDVKFDRESLIISLPSSKIFDWADSNQVSIKEIQELPDGDNLTILVEKDFQCLTPRDEDESDLFPHPEGNDLNQ